MLLASFFPLALLILAVLGSIVFGFATPTEAAAVGAFGGFVLAAAYRFIEHWRRRPGGNRNRAPSGSTLRELGGDPEGVVVPHGQDDRHGVLAVRGLGHLLGGFRAARRTGARSRSGCSRWI